MKRVIIVHGWEGSPKDNWLPWLKEELEKTGAKVIVPEMPDTDNPKIRPWLEKLMKTVGTVDKDTFFIGHSIGCQAIMRLLEKEKSACGGCLFVAGWFHLTNLEPGTEGIAAPWIETPIDFAKVKKHSGKIIALFSDDDPYVPLSDVELFKERLGCETAIAAGKGHFDIEEDEYILKLAKRLTR